MIGKKNGKVFVVLIDHGMTKPERGLEKIDRILMWLDGIADAFFTREW